MGDITINGKNVITQSGSAEPVLASNVTGGAGLTLQYTNPTFTNPTIVGTGTFSGNTTIAGTATFSGDLVPSTPLSHRNMIINGAMTVFQRGITKTSVSSGYSTADRWKTFQSTVGAFTQSIESDAPSGFAKSLKMNCTTAEASLGSADRLWVGQLLEGQNIQSFQYGTSSAKDITFSFWVKSNVTGTYIIMLYAASGRSVSQSYTISSSATWEYKTVTFSGDTTGTFTVNNSGQLDIRFFLAAGSNYTSGTLSTTWSSTVNANTAAGQTNLASATSQYWQITGVQLELGSNATPFEHRTVQDVLLACQRYYFVFGRNRTYAVGRTSNTTAFHCSPNCPVPMRATPSIGVPVGQARNFNCINQNAATNCNNQPTVDAYPTTIPTTSGGIEEQNTVGQVFFDGGSGLTDGRVCTIRTNQGLTFDAEL
jgi:hypothetical protein